MVKVLFRGGWFPQKFLPLQVGTIYKLQGNQLQANNQTIEVTAQEMIKHFELVQEAYRWSTKKDLSTLNIQGMDG